MKKKVASYSVTEWIRAWLQTCSHLISSSELTESMSAALLLLNPKQRDTERTEEREYFSEEISIALLVQLQGVVRKFRDFLLHTSKVLHSDVHVLKLQSSRPEICVRSRADRMVFFDVLMVSRVRTASAVCGVLLHDGAVDRFKSGKVFALCRRSLWTLIAPYVVYIAPRDDLEKIIVKPEHQWEIHLNQW